MSASTFATEAIRALRNTTTGELETFATHKLSGWFAYEQRLTQGWQDDFEMSERQELLTILEPNQPEASNPAHSPDPDGAAAGNGNGIHGNEG